MKAFCFASSSAGNCYLFKLDTNRGAESASILLEAGIPYQQIIDNFNNYNQDISKVNCVLITHGHQDHCKSARALFDRSVPVYQSKGTSAYDGVPNTEMNELIPGRKKWITSDVSVYPFLVEHDIEDPLGFVIQVESTQETILFVNDCKYFKEDLSQYDHFDYIFIESNYIAKRVYAQYGLAKEANDKKLIFQYERLLNSHMSVETTIKTLKKLQSQNKLNQCIAIFLMHLSDANANEYIMKQNVQAAIGSRTLITLVCGKNGGIK